MPEESTAIDSSVGVVGLVIVVARDGERRRLTGAQGCARAPAQGELVGVPGQHGPGAARQVKIRFTAVGYGKGQWADAVSEHHAPGVQA